MLKKKLCKKCRERFSYGWNEDTEIIWEECKQVLCLSPGQLKEKDIFIDIIDEPPNDCYYLLEQILSKED